VSSNTEERVWHSISTAVVLTSLFAAAMIVMLWGCDEAGRDD
jgi:hypothetical protein